MLLESTISSISPFLRWWSAVKSEDQQIELMAASRTMKVCLVLWATCANTRFITVFKNLINLIISDQSHHQQMENSWWSTVNICVWLLCTPKSRYSCKADRLDLLVQRLWRYCPGDCLKKELATGTSTSWNVYLYSPWLSLAHVTQFWISTKYKQDSKDEVTHPGMTIMRFAILLYLPKF